MTEKKHELNNVEKSLKIAIVLTSIFFVVELIGSYISGSISLLGDAGHMFRDVFAILITYYSIIIAKKLPAKTKTFGYHRIEIFGAFINGLILLGMSIWIFIESYQRLNSPRSIQSTTMFAVALLGLIINLYIILKLHGSHDVNIKSAFIHVLTDAISSIAVILASILIYLTNQTIIDSILGMAIGLFILYSAISILNESSRILLEFTPKDINFDEVIKDIESVKGVDGIHDVHIWCLCSNINVMDAHVYTNENDMSKIELIKREIKKRLEKYNIKHATLEFECEECIRSNKLKELCH